MVFVNTRDSVEELFALLKSDGWGQEVTMLSGGLDHHDRRFNLFAFQTEQSKPVMICTEVASRGLDVVNLELVINYHCPSHFEAYVHQVGRTGRAGKRGMAHTFMMKGQDDQMAPDIVRALDSSGNDVPDWLREIASRFAQECQLGLVVYYSKRGYGGHGFRFDREESRRKKEELRRQMKALELDGQLTESSSDEEPDEDGFMVRKPKEPKEKKKMLSGGVGTALQQIQRARTFAAELTARHIAEAQMALQNHFEQEVEINDYPERVTNRENFENLQEQFDTAVTTKGIWCQGEAPPGERRLYVLVEGRTKDAVDACASVLRDQLDAENRELLMKGGEVGGSALSRRLENGRIQFELRNVISGPNIAFCI